MVVGLRSPFPGWLSTGEPSLCHLVFALGQAQSLRARGGAVGHIFLTSPLGTSLLPTARDSSQLLRAHVIRLGSPDTT